MNCRDPSGNSENEACDRYAAVVVELALSDSPAEVVVGHT